MFTSPHHTVLVVISSFTINLSFGDLPVNFPVCTEMAPEEDILPISFLIVISESISGERFQCTVPILDKPKSDKLSKSGTFPVVFIF